MSTTTSKLGLTKVETTDTVATWMTGFNGNMEILDGVLGLVYPVGSIYMSVNSTSPATLFGGTWQALGGQFLIGANSSYTAGSTGGSATKTIAVTNLPSHKHSVGAHKHGLNSHKHSVGAHAHGLNSHTHSVGAHTHGLNSHTHSVGAHAHGLNSHTHSFTAAPATHTHSLSAYAKIGINAAGERLSFKLASGSYATEYYVGDQDHLLNKTASSGGHQNGYGVEVYGTATANGSTGSLTGAATGNTANSAAFNSGGPSVANTENSTAFNSGGPSVTNTANSTAFDTGAASGDTANSTAFDSGATGGGTALNIMPPYLSVYMWKRTA